MHEYLLRITICLICLAFDLNLRIWSWRWTALRMGLTIPNLFFIYLFRICRRTQEFFSNMMGSVRIRIRIDPPHPLFCRKRRLNVAVLRMKQENPRSCVSQCGTIKIPPCSKALSVEHRPNFYRPSPAKGDVSIYVKNSWAGGKTVNNQSINQ
jgi:hypothetical protein